MTLTASRKYLRATAVGFAIIRFLVLQVAAETAQCADPPGGSVTCESGQVAICAVKNGKVDGRCKTPPTNMKASDLKAFVLSDLTGKKVSASDVNDFKYQIILRQAGQETNGQVVTFKIPKELLKSQDPED